MEFSGINLGAERTGLRPGESPDAVNCFFHEGTRGLLGSRRGKTFFNETAYADTVYGVPSLVLPGGSRYWQTGLNSGAVNQVAAPQASEPTSSLDTPVYKWYSFGAPITQAEIWPGGASTTTQTLPGSIPAGTYEMFLPRTYSISMTVTGGNQEAHFAIYLWFKDAGDNILSNLGNPFTLDKAGDGLVVAADSTSFLKASLSLSATATKILVGVLLLPDPSTSSWTYSAGPFTGVLLRRQS